MFDTRDISQDGTQATESVSLQYSTLTIISGDKFILFGEK